MARYRFRTSWQIAAPLAPVYAAIEDSLDWPQWWPGVVSVNQLHSGDAAGIGNVRRYCWRGRLPYRVVFDITLAAKQPGRRLEGHACGDVCGTGIWLFYVDRASFKFDFYPEGQAYAFNAETHFEDHGYQIDTVNQTLKWTGGVFKIYWNDEATRYAFLNDGTPVIQLSRNAVYGYETLTCTRTGPAKEVSPYQKAIAENDPETELQPPTVLAPLPPAGAGGLSGLYLTLNGSGQWVYDFNGGSTFIPASTRYYYFMADGYYYEGLYGWSYEALDCRRVKKDGKPLCGTYLIRDGQIQLDGGAWVAFEQTASSVTINGKAWIKETPAPATLNGGWSMTNGSSMPNNGGVYVTNSWVFRSDGTFESGSASSVLINSSPQWANTNTTVAGGSSNSHTGRYSIKDYTLTLEYNDGTVVKKVFWVSNSDTDPHAYIYINGSMFYR